MTSFINGTLKYINYEVFDSFCLSNVRCVLNCDLGPENVKSCQNYEE